MSLPTVVVGWLRSGQVKAVLLAGMAAMMLQAKEPEWPQFRGPSANPVGVLPKLPDHWSSTENLEWTADLPGRGWSSPVVVGNRIYVTTVVTEGKSKQPQKGVDFSNDLVAELSKKGASEAEVLKAVTERDIELPNEVKLTYWLYCLDAKSGRPLWKKSFFEGRPPGGRHRKNSFTSETPVTDGKHLYLYIGNLGVFAFKLNGDLMWSERLPANPIYLDFGTGSSPVLHENQLIVLSDNEKDQYLVSFDKRTGKQLWRTQRDLGPKGGEGRRSGWSTPFVWTNQLRTELVTIGPTVAVSYDLAGKELWRLGGMGGSPIPSPFAYQGNLILNGGAGGGLFSVKAGASGDITLASGVTSSTHVAWMVARGGTYLSSPVAYEGGIYTLTEKGVFARYDAATGKVSYKSRLQVDAGYFTSSPWAYNGKIFCLSEEGKTFVVKAGPTFELLHTNSLPTEEMTQASPAIVGERLFLRTESKLYAIRKVKKA